MTGEWLVPTLFYVLGVGALGVTGKLALRRLRWPDLLQWMAVGYAIVIAVLLALCTPVADPRRLSVQDQVRRLESGKVTPEAFDYEFLRFDSPRFGRAALDRLKTSANPEIAKRAKVASALEYRTGNGRRSEVAPHPRITFYPQGAAPPAGFERLYGREPYDDCMVGNMACDARLMDVTGDGKPEVLLTSGGSIQVFGGDATIGWRRLGVFYAQCGRIDARDAVRKGGLKVKPSVVSGLATPEGELQFTPEPKGCPTEIKPLQTPH